MAFCTGQARRESAPSARRQQAPAPVRLHELDPDHVVLFPGDLAGPAGRGAVEFKLKVRFDELGVFDPQPRAAFRDVDDASVRVYVFESNPEAAIMVTVKEPGGIMTPQRLQSVRYQRPDAHIKHLATGQGFRYLLRAFPLVREQFPDARLLVVGRGDTRRYQDFLESRDVRGVEFAGYIDNDELPRYYKSCDLFCAPSTILIVTVSAS